MNRSRLLISAFLGMLLYVLLSVMVGKEGIWAYKQLDSYRLFLKSNVNLILQINADLKISKGDLVSDEDVLASYAKRMGFIHEGEKLVRITGAPEVPTVVYNPGKKTVKPFIRYLSDWILKIVGLSLFIFINFCFAILDLIHNRKGHINLCATALSGGIVHDTKEN